MKNIVVLVLASVLVLSTFGIACSEPEPDVYEIQIALINTEFDTKALSSKATWDAIEQKTNGRLKPIYNYGGTLIHHTEMLYLMRDGLADVGHLVTQYFEADQPLTSVLNLPFLVTGEWSVQGKSFMDMYEAFPEVQKEFADYNIMPLWGFPIEPVCIVSADKISGVDDLQGLRIRAAAACAEVYSLAGATPMAIGGAEYYDATARGIIDATSNLGQSSVVGRSMYEVTNYLVLPGLGLYTGVLEVVNLDTWNGLPDDIRQVILDHDPYATEVPVFAAGMEDDHAFLLDAGMEFVEWSPEELQKLRDIGTPVLDQWIQDRNSEGLPGTEVFEFFTEAVAKYQA